MGVTFICSIISGMILSGALMWYLCRAIAATGAIERFGAGRAMRGQNA
ncbi:MAG: hypothetical protein L0I23_03990 [Bifidobacterium mongoliense]|nr:hypothetical protein [Bifidobacterium mongoliense]MDN6051210.1 hypothetical protein [Bifidobacterium mongoliense]